MERKIKIIRKIKNNDYSKFMRLIVRTIWQRLSGKLVDNYNNCCYNSKHPRISTLDKSLFETWKTLVSQSATQLSRHVQVLVIQILVIQILVA